MKAEPACVHHVQSLLRQHLAAEEQVQHGKAKALGTQRWLIIHPASFLLLPPPLLLLQDLTADDDEAQGEGAALRNVNQDVQRALGALGTQEAADAFRAGASSVHGNYKLQQNSNQVHDFEGLLYTCSAQLALWHMC
jgi:hypothetical protein